MRLKNVLLRTTVMLVISLLFISACERKQQPLRIALLEWPPYELAFWAREKQWFNDQQAVLLEYKTPAEITRAFATQAVDIIAVTSDFALTLMEEYPETRIFMVIDTSYGGDTVLARKPMVKGHDFTDQRIGIESGPLGSFMLARFMDKFSIEEKELQIRYVDIPGQEDMWNSKEIDLLITYDPIRSKLKSQGAVEIFTSKEIPNEIVDVFIIRESLIEEQKHNLTVFVEAWFKAVNDLKAEKPELYEFIGSRVNIPPESLSDIFKDVYVPTYAENLSQLSGDSKQFLQGLEHHETIMLSKKLMTRKVNKEALYTNKGLLLIEPH